VSNKALYLVKCSVSDHSAQELAVFVVADDAGKAQSRVSQELARLASGHEVMSIAVMAQTTWDGKLNRPALVIL